TGGSNAQYPEVRTAFKGRIVGNAEIRAESTFQHGGGEHRKTGPITPIRGTSGYTPSGPYSAKAWGIPSKALLMVLAANSGSLSAIMIAAAIIPPLQTWFQLLVPLIHPICPS